MAAANHEDAVHLLNMAEAALELAARELGGVADWNAVLDGRVRSSMVDGPPSGTRRISADSVIDLTGMTNDLTCGRASGCTDVDQNGSDQRSPVGREQSVVAAVPLWAAHGGHESSSRGARVRRRLAGR